MPACEAVHPYVPDPRIDWAEVDPEAAELSRSCTGDFADPVMDGEMRRFLWRDLMPTVMHTVAFWLYAVFPLVLIGGGMQELTILDLFGALFALAIMSVVWPLDVYAFFRMKGNLKTATIRMMIGPLYGVAAAPRYLAFPARYITLCGDQDAIHLNITNPNNTAAIMAAIDDRQKYCIDRLDSAVIALVCAVVPILRLYPQHAIPLVVTFMVFYGIGYALRPSTDEARYEDNTGPIAANISFQLATIVTGILLGYRLHATNRGRFIAAAAAERARRLAVRELAEVDALLKRSLPEAVLERVAVGADVTDRSELVSVLLSDLAGFTAWSSSRSAQQVVAMLNVLVSAFDDRLAGAPGVEKVKTIGDAYWAVAGLPLPVACHASVLCRFALGMQATAHALAQEHAAAWGGADAVRMRVGVHSGRASGSILGTQRLSYEPFGEACEGAEEAEKHCAVGAVCVTDAVRERLAFEATEFGDDADTESLYATANEVGQTLKAHATVTHESNGETYRLFLFPETEHSAPTGGITRVSSTLNALPGLDNASACTRRTTRTHQSIASTVAGALAQGDDARRQKQQLEQRMKFVMQRAAENEKRARRRNQKTGGAGIDGDFGDDNGVAVANADEEPENAADALEQLQDPEHGPFARATRVPLVYSFADPDEELGYLQYARESTREMRRDVRVGTALLFLVTLVSNAATGGDAASIAVLAVAFVVALANAALLVAGAPHADQADTVLAYVAFLFELVGCYLADGNVVGNDPYWIYPVQTTLVDFTVYTLSPLSRSGLNTFFNLAAFAKLAYIGKGDVQGNFAITGAGLASLPFLKALIENFSRRAYVERRLAEALAAQEHAAKAAQTAMLENVVPRHAIAPLRAWLGHDFAAEHAIVQELPNVAVCFVKLRGFTNAGSPAGGSPLGKGPAEAGAGGGMEWMLEAHRAADALLDRCVYVTKIKTIGQTLMLAGPFGDAARAAADDAAANPAVAVPGASPGIAANLSAAHVGITRTLADIVYVVTSLARLGVQVQAGVHAGAVAGAVLGTERLSYDILGDTVNHASRVTSGLSQLEDTIASPLRKREDVTKTPETADSGFPPATLTAEAVVASALALRNNGSSFGLSPEVMRAIAPSASIEQFPATVLLPTPQLISDDASSASASLRRSNGSPGASLRSGFLELTFMPTVFGVKAKGKGTLDVFVVESIDE